MTTASTTQAISSLAELLTVAYRIEADAVERYTMLAEQMVQHNNPELVKIFRDLARAEGIHAEEIRRQAGAIDVAQLAQQPGPWKTGESPEAADLGAAHYLMTPWHALQIALTGEERALAYFKSVVEGAADSKIKDMAEEFVEEEAEHVNLVHRLLRKYPSPPASWGDDSDPANPA